MHVLERGGGARGVVFPVSSASLTVALRVPALDRGIRVLTGRQSGRKGLSSPSSRSVIDVKMGAPIVCLRRLIYPSEPRDPSRGMPNARTVPNRIRGTRPKDGVLGGHAAEESRTQVQRTSATRLGHPSPDSGANRW